MTPEIALQWIVDNPHAHPANMVAVAKEGLASMMANGLTEAETSATASVSGLTVKPWTKWTGGRCPTALHDTVEIRYDDGDTSIDLARLFYWEWQDSGTLGDIIAYRVL